MGTLITIIAPYLSGIAAATLSVIFVIINVIALYGGISVIDGAILISMGGAHRIPGKIIIGIGSGVGLIGFIIDHIIVAFQGGLTVQLWLLLLQSPGYIGAILAILAVIYAKD